MPDEIKKYHTALPIIRRDICNEIFNIIENNLTYTENKIWHGHPVWFINGNPIVGYSSLKSGIKLMFWSGVSFNELGLQQGTGKFKDASITYGDVNDIVAEDVIRWLGKSETIQWDYKNIVKRKGVLERLK